MQGQVPPENPPQVLSVEEKLSRIMTLLEATQAQNVVLRSQVDELLARDARRPENGIGNAAFDLRVYDLPDEDLFKPMRWTAASFSSTLLRKNLMTRLDHEVSRYFSHSAEEARVIPADRAHLKQLLDQMEALLESADQQARSDGGLRSWTLEPANKIMEQLLFLQIKHQYGYRFADWYRSELRRSAPEGKLATVYTRLQSYVHEVRLAEGAARGKNRNEGGGGRGGNFRRGTRPSTGRGGRDAKPRNATAESSSETL